MSKVWAVLGEQGDYSDHFEWIVAVFKSQAAADSRALAARTRNQQLEEWERNRRNDPDMKDALDAINRMNVNYNNTRYEDVHKFWDVPENKALQTRYNNLLEENRQKRASDPEMNALDPKYVHRGRYDEWPDEYTVVETELVEE